MNTENYVLQCGINRQRANLLYHEVYEEMSLGSVWDSPSEGKSTVFWGIGYKNSGTASCLPVRQS